MFLCVILLCSFLLPPLHSFQRGPLGTNLWKKNWKDTAAIMMQLDIQQHLQVKSTASSLLLAFTSNMRGKEMLDSRTLHQKNEKDLQNKLKLNNSLIVVVSWLLKVWTLPNNYLMGWGLREDWTIHHSLLLMVFL